MVKIKKYSKSLAIAYFVAGILLCIASVVLAYTNVNDNMLLSFVFAIVIVTNLIGGMILSKGIKKQGILNGIIFGIIYFLILYVISALFYNGIVFNKTIAMYLTMCVISGAIGGVVGVNI